MICLEEFAMPAVRERTVARGVGIIARGPRDESALKRGSDMCLVFAKGGTGAADDLLEPLKARCEKRQPKVDCLWRDEVQAIGNAAVVIGRPGIGTITECIEDGVPLLAIVEDNSPEMAHNASRIEALGLGASLRAHELDRAEAVIAKLASRRFVFGQAALALARDGAERAADLIAARLTKEKVA
jgi:UDP-N-acetylglucosamine:LPS N-acetylglucosamine transferase